MTGVLFLAVCLALIAAVIVFILNLWDRVPPGRAVTGATACGAATAGLVIGGYFSLFAFGWIADRMVVGMRDFGAVHFATATVIGLSVVGVYLSVGRTSWRAALCGAGVAASFLTVLAIVVGGV